MTEHTPDHLRHLADRVRRLQPSRRDPEAFHLDKDLIAVELHRIARRLERAAEA